MAVLTNGLNVDDFAVGGGGFVEVDGGQEVALAAHGQMRWQGTAQQESMS